MVIATSDKANNALDLEEYFQQIQLQKHTFQDVEEEIDVAKNRFIWMYASPAECGQWQGPVINQENNMSMSELDLEVVRNSWGLDQNCPALTFWGYYRNCQQYPLFFLHL